MKFARMTALMMVLVLIPFAGILINSEDTQGATVFSDITVDTTWTQSGGPYIVLTAIAVKSPAVLTIEGGTEVIFKETEGSFLIEDGAKLIVQGNDTHRVEFKDDYPENFTQNSQKWNGITIQGSGSKIIGANFTQANPALVLKGDNNVVLNSTFSQTTSAIKIEGMRNLIQNNTLNNTDVGITIQGEANLIKDNYFTHGIGTGIYVNFASNNMIEGCRISNPAKGVHFKSSSESNYLNSTNIIGASTAVHIETSSNVKINGSGMVNNNYCVLVDGVSINNELRNCSMMVSREYIVKTNNPLDAASNYWGVTDPVVIGKMVSGNVDTSDPLSADPVGIGIPMINTAEQWTSATDVVGGRLVQSDLTISSTAVFNDEEGFNFLFISGSLTLTGAALGSNAGPYTIFFAPGSSGTITDSTISNEFSILCFTGDLEITGSSFDNGSNALVLTDAENVVIDNCTFKDNNNALKTTNSPGLNLADNIFDDAVSLKTSDDCIIQRNRFTDGLTIQSSEGVIVSANNFSNINGIAVHLTSSSLCSVLGNDLYSNNIGVQLSPGSNNNMISKNNFEANTDAQVYALTSTEGNMIYHNNFFAIGTFTLINNGINFWNNSENQGNYWYGYIGVDDGSDGRKKGDGIGDTSVPFMGVENFPYISPNGWLLPEVPTMDPFGATLDDDGSFDVSWQLAGRGDFYVLLQSSDSFATETEIYNSTGNKTSVSELEKGTYHFKVRAGNDLGYSAWSNVITISVNRYPEADTSDVIVKFDEDSYSGFSLNLSNVFTDPDMDVLEYSFEEPKDLKIEINEEGFINVSAKKENWNGEETVKFFATDGTYTVNKTLIFQVEAVNDAPTGAKITTTPNTIYLGHSELINLTGICSDVDTAQDNITYSWTSNISGKIGTGPVLKNLTLAPGVHEITLNATDGQFWSIAKITISKDPAPIIKPPPSDDDDDNQGNIVVAAVALGVVALIILGVVGYLLFRNMSLHKVDEEAKEEAEMVKEEEIKKIDTEKAAHEQVVAQEAATGPGPVPDVQPEIDLESGPEMEGPYDSEQMTDVPQLEELGPVSAPEGGGSISPEEKQKMLDELDELLFADKISEEEYIAKVNEIEAM